jgi:hypothetical protein
VDPQFEMMYRLLFGFDWKDSDEATVAPSRVADMIDDARIGTTWCNMNQNMQYTFPSLREFKVDELTDIDRVALNGFLELVSTAIEMNIPVRCRYRIANETLITALVLDIQRFQSYGSDNQRSVDDECHKFTEQLGERKRRHYTSAEIKIIAQAEANREEAIRKNAEARRRQQQERMRILQKLKEERPLQLNKNGRVQLTVQAITEKTFAKKLETSHAESTAYQHHRELRDAGVKFSGKILADNDKTVKAPVAAPVDPNRIILENIHSVHACANLPEHRSQKGDGASARLVGGTFTVNMPRSNGYGDRSSGGFGGRGGDRRDDYGRGSGDRRDDYGRGSGDRRDDYGRGSGDRRDDYGRGSGDRRDDYGRGSGDRRDNREEDDRGGAGSGAPFRRGANIHTSNTASSDKRQYSPERAMESESSLSNAPFRRGANIQTNSSRQREYSPEQRRSGSPVRRNEAVAEDSRAFVRGGRLLGAATNQQPTRQQSPPRKRPEAASDRHAKQYRGAVVRERALSNIYDTLSGSESDEPEAVATTAPDWSQIGRRVGLKC